MGYTRVYYIYTKKNISWNIVFNLLLAFLGIPIRFLKLSYYFIKSKSTFRETLIQLYCNTFYNVKHHKIEILNGVVYLNCYTVGKLLGTLASNVNSKENMWNLICEMKILCNQNVQYEEYHNSLTRLPLAKIILVDGKRVPGYHYAFNEGKNAIHATTNVPNNIHFSQKCYPPINSLIKENATNPGIILSKDIKNITFYKNWKICNTYELEYIKIHCGNVFLLDNHIFNYNLNKKYAIINLLSKYCEDNNLPNYFIDEYMCNCYTHTIISIGIDDFEYWYNS